MNLSTATTAPVAAPLPASAAACALDSGPTNSVAEADDVWPRPNEERPSRRERLKQQKAVQAPKSWLDRDPFGWIGRKVRSRKTGATFTVRNVYRSGRVDLEKSWMTYSYTVKTIRADFETYS